MNNSNNLLRTSTSVNAMIVALEPVEFIPYGRHAISNHPGLSCLHLHQSQAPLRLDRSLIGSFSKVSLDDRNRVSERWHLRKYANAEEELYICKNTIVWSRGYKVISTYTIDSPVIHAIWCSFVIDGEDSHIHELYKNTDEHGENKKNVEGFVAVSDGSLHVFSREGDDFVTALPFQVRKVWNTDFGLVFERNQNSSDSAPSVSSSDKALTTVFCLQHPLREFAPVVKKFQGSVHYMNRTRESVVFCEENLLMTFDSKHGLHTVWKMRRIVNDDITSLDNNVGQQQQIHNQMSSNQQMTISSPGISPMRGSFRGSPAAPILPNISAGPSGLQLLPSVLARTPHTSRNPSFAHLSQTPNSSRLCSPSVNSINYPSHTFSPLHQSSHFRSPSGPISHESLCLNESVHESAEPLRPEICLEHVWSENVVGTREGLSVGCATKAFLSEDVCGQKFLVYYIDNLRQLRLVKYGLTNDKSQFIFGAVVTYPARDATQLKDLNMIALLDMVGNVILYTGTVKMVKMHVTGVPMSSLSLSHGLRNPTPSLGTPQPVSTPAHPSRPGSVLGNLEEVNLLSPVPELAFSGDTDISLLTLDEHPFTNIGQSSSSAIISLPQVVGSSLFLEVSNGSYYKSDIPQLFTTTLIETCLKALHQVLPNHLYLQIIIKWYSMRYSPGAMTSYQSEWAIFEACLREIIGYSNLSNRHTAGTSQQMEADVSVSPVVAAKKARHIQESSAQDWKYLLDSDFHIKHHRNFGIFTFEDEDSLQNDKSKESNFELLNLSQICRRSSLDKSTDRSGNTMHPLGAVFCVLHLVYEEQKLDIMTWKNVIVMSKFLQQLANDIGLKKFSLSYAMDNPDLICDDMLDKIKGFDPQTYKLPACFSELEPNIFSNLQHVSKYKNCTAPFPVIDRVTTRTKQILMIYDCLFKDENASSSVTELGHFTQTSTFKKDKSIDMSEEFCATQDERTGNQISAAHRALKYMIDIGITSEQLHTLPHGVALPIFTALHQCKELPDLNFSNKALELIEITRLLFPNDHRISEAHNLLQAQKPILIDLTQQPGVSDHEFQELTRARLLTLCNRTMALAVGSGMMSLQTKKPIPTEPFEIPHIDWTGRCVKTNTTVDLDSGNIEVPPLMKNWPEFHNGVAAGLKIMPQKYESSWIYLNKPKTNTNVSNRTNNQPPTELSSEHAGFLLALGLNGHLEKLHTLNIHDYLSRTHEMTTIGLLLGLGTSKCGSCDLSIMRILSVHIPALLPPTSTEFDVPRVIQTAAVTAVGYLYLGSAQRLVAEVMLREIDRPLSPENDTGEEREAYALSCGIALGAITLGRGSNIPELADLNMTDQLYHFLTGRRKPSNEPVGQSIILEGDQVNTEVTAPGAIIALTLMFLKTNNITIADWFTAPETLLLLEAIRPQHLMLRTMARSLILWDFVVPSKEWVENHIPSVIRTHLSASRNFSESSSIDPLVDVQTILQCHASILTGACLALGIRFAGSQNKSAYGTLRHFILFFLSIWNEQSGTARSTASAYPLEVMGRYTLENCLTTCLLALSMVVAGSGDMETLQLCRFLHVTVGAEINYGMQMATHMALGFLFLGNCRKTLSTSNKSICAILTAVFPCFPCSSTDNRYHLQALRHFYVLATEQRLLVPIDSSTNLPCYAQINIKFTTEFSGEEHSCLVMAPYMLPEQSQLKEIKLKLMILRHWPLCVDIQTQADKLKELFEVGLSVQRRAGFQSYIKDPKGHRSLLARSSQNWSSLLTDDVYNIRSYAETFLNYVSDDNNSDNSDISAAARRISLSSSLLENFVTEEKSQTLHIFCGLQQIFYQLQNFKKPNTMSMWQLKIAFDFMKQIAVPNLNKQQGFMTSEHFIAILSS
uniref:anaphase-promoting complex subunit 1-like n=1 Tax=Styela clava TaxID=7725 RepID=UPI001939B049|nr:anaphase-promoting complex subunit 1-like [Styela clava]